MSARQARPTASASAAAAMRPGIPIMTSSSPASVDDHHWRPKAAAPGGGPVVSWFHTMPMRWPDVDPFYTGADSLFVRAYDAFYRNEPPQIAGDVAFYARLARETGGRVLELACGTGRVTLALAEQGLDITGVDMSDGML